MYGAMTPDEFQDSFDKFVTSQFRCLPENLPIIEMPFVIGITAWTAQGTLACHLQRKKRSVSLKDPAPGRNDLPFFHL